MPHAQGLARPLLLLLLTVAAPAATAVQLRDWPFHAHPPALSGPLTCDVRTYGAVPDGKTLSTAGIQAAIDDCSRRASQNAPGVVLLPRAAPTGSVYLSGSLFLKSNIVFFVDEGVTLLGSPAKDNTTYPQVYTRVAGTMQYGHASLINGALCTSINFNASAVGDQCREWAKLENVTIAGYGTLDGNGDSGWWNKPYFNDRPTLLGLLWISSLTILDLKFVNPPFWTVSRSPEEVERWVEKG